MKYNVGDKVMVRRDLKGGRMYDGTYMNPAMEKHRGCVFTVSGTSFFGYKLEGCKRDETGTSWVWSEEMLEPYEQFSAGGIVPQEMLEPFFAGGIVPQNAPRKVVTVNDWERYMPIIDFNEAYKKTILSCGTISLTLGNARKNKSGIESRKDIRKRLLKL